MSVWNLPSLSCETCGASLSVESVEKHDQWHRALRTKYCSTCGATTHPSSWHAPSPVPSPRPDDAIKQRVSDAQARTMLTLCGEAHDAPDMAMHCKAVASLAADLLDARAELAAHRWTPEQEEKA